MIDSEKDHYEVMHVGCDGIRRVHIDIIRGKIGIQYDGTNRPIAEKLLDAGIPRDAIVLGFHSEHVRKYTDFAVI